jgi:hypothetical protein
MGAGFVRVYSSPQAGRGRDGLCMPAREGKQRSLAAPLASGAGLLALGGSSGAPSPATAFKRATLGGPPP